MARPLPDRWHRAWWRTLVRYNRRLTDLRRQDVHEDEAPDASVTDTSGGDD